MQLLYQRHSSFARKALVVCMIDQLHERDEMKKNVGRVIDIIRYPIKGFAGESLSKVELKSGGGVPGDRRWAIRNGSIDVEDGGAWAPCQAFLRLTQETDLPRYRVKSTEKDNVTTGISLHHPDGHSISVENSAENIDRLSSWFLYKNMGFSKSRPDIGYWDHSDAKISIINLTTVKALSEAAGVELSPKRFRGNFLIQTDEPWAEFSLVGQRIRIGEVELEVLRPIDRCKATSVNPVTADDDVNIPHLLASQFGHVFCGVYARVVKSGAVTTGALLSTLAIAPQAVIDATKVSTAPTLNDWPRPMRVLQRINESEKVVSFWLEDSLADLTGRIAPSSYVRLHCQTENGPMSRSYTISDWAADGKHLRVSIKNEGVCARFSPWIHQVVNEGDDLLVSGPFVDPSLTWRPELSACPVLIVTAGIGITVASSVLSALRQNKHHHSMGRPIRIVHGVRDQTELALWQEILCNIDRDDDVQTALFMSRADVAQCQQFSAKKGHIDLTNLIYDFDVSSAQVFICGPAGFSKAIRKKLLSIGVNEGCIHEDFFSSPALSKPVTRIASQTKPVPVRFSDSSTHCDTVWKPDSGTLLDLADENGIKLPANCRSGACRVCVLPVSGAVEYLTEPVAPAPKGHAYMCCAAPLGDLTVFTKKLY